MRVLLRSQFRNYQLFFVGFLLVFFSCFSFGFDINNKRFSHITSLDGLSSSNLYSILKDSRGYIWVGTGNGLNRYDGYDIRVYKFSETHPNSISNNFIWSLHEDHHSNIWVGTKNGLNKFNVKTEKFIRINNEENISKTSIYSLLVNDDSLWVGAHTGFYSLNPDSDIIRNVFSGRPVYDIAKIDKYLWLASSGKIFRYNLSTGKITEYNLPSVAQVLDIVNYEDILLMGTTDGIIRFDIKTGKVDLKNRILPGVVINEMFIDDLNNVLIGTRLFGLHIYSLHDKKLDKISSDTFDKFYLQSNDVSVVMIDDNILWVSGGDGLSYTLLDNSLGFFRAAREQVMSNSVYQLNMDKAGGLWIASDKGVSRYLNNKTTHYEIGVIRNLFVSDSLILAYIDNHVYKYNEEKDAFEVHDLEGLIFKEFGVKRLRDILQLDGKQYLLASFNGLILWDKNDNILLEIEYDGKGPFGDNIKKLYKYNNRILLGTTSGLYEFNKELRKINRYLIHSELTILDKAYIEYMDVDDDGFLWLSTDKGLFKVKNRQIVSRYTGYDGLSDIAIRSAVIIDDIVWVSTDKGVNAFQIKNNQFKKVHLNASQFNVEFNGGAVYKSNGYLYFGGMEGVLYFKPEEFLESAKPPSTLITDFHLFNKRVTPGTELLPNAIDFTKQLVLNHDNNMLTFEFSSMNYSQPNHLYAYQLEGLTKENDWLITDAKNRRATFTPPPGEYTFRVKSGWDKNTWSDEVAEVKVTILPPWWQTTWAYTLYITLTLIILFVIYQIRTRNIRQRSIELENQVKERTTALQSKTIELESKTIEVQSQKETIEKLMDKKNEMFANISHELRTPITLIHGPIHQTLEKFSYGTEVEPLIMAERNAERLSFLVDQLLQLSRLYDFPDENRYAYSLSNIATAICSSFQSLSVLQQVKFSVVIEPEIYISALPNALDTILINLISNAFKYTEENDQIDLVISKQNSKVIVSIKDTGIGMPADKLQNIFDRFTRIESQKNKKVQGVGVGLALVKQLVELHGGSIHVNSQEGEGTEFVVELIADDAPSEMPSNDEALGADSLKQIHYIQSQFEQNKDKISRQVMNSDKSETVIKPKLLIIDDTDDMRSYLESLLSADYQCILVDNGEEGIALAKSENPDIIISDVMMPGISGFEVLDQLREDLLTSHIPVLLLTAKGDKESKLLGLSKLADDYITKPFDADELKARIHSILVIRQLQQRALQKLVEENEQSEGEWQKADLSLKEKEFLDKLNEVIEDNYSNEAFTVEELANRIHLSSRALLNKLKGLLGKTPNEYIRETRLNKAKELILIGDVNIGDLSEKVGFNNASYFHRCFKAYVGCTPKQFMNVKRDFSRDARV